VGETSGRFSMWRGWGKGGGACVLREWIRGGEKEVGVTGQGRDVLEVVGGARRLERGARARQRERETETYTKKQYVLFEGAFFW